jgi:hypothetical protein
MSAYGDVARNVPYSPRPARGARGPRSSSCIALSVGGGAGTWGAASPRPHRQSGAARMEFQHSSSAQIARTLGSSCAFPRSAALKASRAHWRSASDGLVGNQFPQPLRPRDCVACRAIDSAMRSGRITRLVPGGRLTVLDRRTRSKRARGIIRARRRQQPQWRAGGGMNPRALTPPGSAPPGPAPDRPRHRWSASRRAGQ